ncbi:glycosyltransferase [Halomonas alimentaria]|uniref:Glycosyltransferase n=1 Tax=Halomonas alimentaria TaxID=147248 RepID=A0A7X5AQ86_9GAMM|nr:glycosyltransferase [Halomonas alimentaria]
MKVLVFSGFYLPGYKGGGPIKTIANLVATTSDAVDYHIITKDRDLGDTSSYENINSNAWSSHGGAKVFYCSSGLRGIVRGWLQVLRGSHDIVYLNSFFSPFFSFVPLLLCKVIGRRVVLGPRGEFSLGALSLKAKKKERFIRLFKMLGLNKGVVFQASTEFEKSDIYRALGDDIDVFVAENIGLLEAPEAVPCKVFDKLKLVFISRVSPKKNLLYALEALKDVKALVSYDIYGPLEDADYWQQCLNVIAELPENVEVAHKGELTPNQVVPTLSQYDMFFMPTQGENYGHVIAEALCAGLPVLISDQTPWRGLEARGIGWDLPLDDKGAFVQAIEQAHAMSADEYADFRERVLAWAKQKFENPEAIEANKAMFEYALKKK